MLPKWKSHKILEGDKIVAVGSVGIAHREGPDDSGVRWTLACGDEIVVSLDLMARVPLPAREALGGYYAKYADGFESWSPAKAWEEGNTRLPEGE